MLDIELLSKSFIFKQPQLPHLYLYIFSIYLYLYIFSIYSYPYTMI